MTLAHVRHALQQARPGFAAHERMLPQRPPGSEPPLANRRERAAAVLILVYPVDAVPHLALTRRTDTVQNHKGQISLPGGSREGAESPIETALREANEEIAVNGADLEILGTLSPIYIGVSDYLITPVVAIAPRRPDFRPDPVEVVEIIEAPLSVLLDPGVRVAEDWVVRGVTVRIPFFAIGPHKVWGATAMILSEFAAMLEQSSPTST
jgi:8-oxo-dGTP pyrophosphatase MutT (NUDIX family)